jgi:hypothetical protein
MFHQSSNPFGLIFIDIDHFKKVKDKFGHTKSDLVLRMVANTLRHNLQDADSLGRWGGENSSFYLTIFVEQTWRLLPVNYCSWSNSPRGTASKGQSVSPSHLAEHFQPRVITWKHWYNVRMN